jgi:hypothetical protein
MNVISRGISPVVVHLAQQSASPLENITSDLSRSVPNLLYAIVILVVGWIIAIVAASVVKAVLSRTNLDNRLAAQITGRPDGAAVTNLEKWIATAVFWIVMIFVLVAFLQQLQLSAVSEPLNNFLGQIFAFLPKLAGAAILLGVAWIIATLAKLLLTRGLQAFSLDDRLNQASGGPEGPGGPGTTQSQFLVSDTLGNALYWFIFLLFLPAILGALDLEGLLQPVQNLLDEILAILPNILAAVLIGLAGWFIARIVRLIVTNLLTATGVDRLGERLGLRQATGGRGLSWLIGYIVYVLILIPAAIAALNALQLEAVSRPASEMLQQILNAIPRVFTAALILVLAYVIGKFVAELVSNILDSIGFNNIFSHLGLPEPPRRTRPTPPTEPTMPPPPMEDPTVSPSTGPAVPPPRPETGAIQPATAIQEQTPSELAGVVVLVGIMILATVPAVSVLGFEVLTAIVRDLLVVFGRVLVGLLIFGVGLYLANLAFSLIVRSGTNQSRVLGQVARVAIIALVAAMALQQMGIASNIVNLAFGLLLGAIAVAIALAFGLGSMDIAAEQVREWLMSFKRRNNPPPY